MNLLRRVWAKMSVLPERRYVYIVFFVLLFIGLAQLGSYFVSESLDANWESISKEKGRFLVKQALNSFSEFQAEVLAFGDEVARDDELRGVLKRYFNGEKGQLVSVFHVLERKNKDDQCTIEIYDRTFGCVAWSGRRVPSQDTIIKKGLAGGRTSIVSRGFIYSYLTTVVPLQVTNNGVDAVVVCSRILEVNYPLHNRFLRSTGLAAQLSSQTNTRIEFDFSSDATESRDGRTISASISGIEGDKIGMCYIAAPTRSASMQAVRDFASKITAYLVVLLSLVISCYVWRGHYRTGRSVAHLALLTFHLWAVRYLWLLIGFPSQFSDAHIFQPTHFASPFGLGIAKNIVELLISVIFLLLNSTYAFVVALEYVRGRASAIPSKRGINTLSRLALLILLAVNISLLFRGYGAAVRSLVFDSTLRYFNPTSVFPRFAVGMMELNLLVLTVSLTLCAVASLLMSIKIVHEGGSSFKSLRLGSWVTITVLFVVIGAAANQVSRSPFPLPYQIIFTLLFLSGCALIWKKIVHGGRFSLIRYGALLIIVCVTIVYLVLDGKLREYQREQVQSAANELVQPVDSWMTFVLNETAREISNDENLIIELEDRDIDRLPALAFQVWAASPLSREGLNSAIVVMDTSGHQVSLFSIGISDNEIVQSLSSIGDTRAAQPLLTSFIESRGRKKYAGLVPVIGAKGFRIGSVVILLPAREWPFFEGATPEVLRSYERESVASEIDNVITSEFIGGELISSTSIEFPRGYRVPDEVYTNLKESSVRAVWLKEKIEGGSYWSYYVFADPIEGKERFLSLSIEDLDVRWHVFNFFKIGIFYLAIGIICLLMYFGFRLVGGQRYKVSFRDKILFAFLVVSVVPTLLIWFYVREFTIESGKDTVEKRLSEDLMVVSESLTRWLGEDIESSGLSLVVTNDFCKGVASETGREFNFYIGSEILASSRPEVFQTELLDRRLRNQAYASIVLSGKRVYFEDESIGRFPYVVGYGPLLDNRGKVVAIVSIPTLYHQVQLERELARTSAFIFGGYSFVLVVIVVLSTLFANRISLPVRKLTEATRLVSKGELNAEVEVKNQDELGTLVDSFNNMLRDLRESRRKLAFVERELAWREMAKQVAHEIKNPLTPMRLMAQHLLQAYRDKAQDFGGMLEAATKTLIEQIDALSRIASEFSNFAKMPQRRYEKCDLNQLVAEAVRLFEGAEAAERPKVDFVQDFSNNVPDILADREELRRVFINIMRNGVQAISSRAAVRKGSTRGKIQIESRYEDGFATVTISDNGCGISDDIKARLFEPNFSTKSDGMGLGLAISKRTVDDLNGKIEIESHVGKGTTVKIILPVT
jgi:signal transduction histidine kinase